MTQDYQEEFHPLSDQHLGGTHTRRWGGGYRAFAVMDGGRQEAQPQKSQERIPSHSAIGAQQWSTERGQKEAPGQEFSWKQRQSGLWLE